MSRKFGTLVCLTILLICVFVVDETAAQYFPFFGNGLGYGYNAYSYGNPLQTLLYGNYNGYYGKREAGFGPSETKH